MDSVDDDPVRAGPAGADRVTGRGWARERADRHRGGHDHDIGVEVA